MIADEVGLHKSSLFHHYRGKLELASEVCLAAMERVIDACLDHFAEEPDAARLLLSLLVAPEDSDLNLPVGRSDADHPVMRLFTILGGWLERARSRGVTRRLSIRQTVPNLMGIVLMQPAVALGTSALTGRDPFSPRQRAQRRAEVHALLAGLFPPGG